MRPFPSGMPSLPQTAPSATSATDSLSEPRLVACDGCGAELYARDCHNPIADAYQCHYCSACYHDYCLYLADAARYEADLNRMLDEYLADRRERCPLKVMPQDFPKLGMAKLS